ncbi:hypothetical protein [Serratia fonticola]|uniref:hypothetical protein n=1 Tax=Serratia fonticola TaxID=47917 RepID=UPI0021ADE0EF|nr:hypothetical protein [Serratia fonticola]
MVRYFSRSLLAILCQASLGSGVLLGAVSVTQAKIATNQTMAVLISSVLKVNGNLAGGLSAAWQ